VSRNRASIRLAAVAAVASMLLGPVAASAAAWDRPDCNEHGGGDHHGYKPERPSHWSPPEKPTHWSPPEKPSKPTWPKPAPAAPKPTPPAPIPAAPVAPPAPAAPPAAPVVPPVPEKPAAPKPAAPTTPAKPAPPVEQPTSPPVALGVPSQPVPETVTPLTPPDKGGVLGKVRTREEAPQGKTTTRDEGGVQPAVLFKTADSGPTATQNTAQLAQTGLDVRIMIVLGVLAIAGSGLLFWRTRAS
jgi:LPXTG-motif cell wall-anchored protein